MAVGHARHDGGPVHPNGCRLIKAPGGVALQPGVAATVPGRAGDHSSPLCRRSVRVVGSRCEAGKRAHDSDPRQRRRIRVRSRVDDLPVQRTVRPGRRSARAVWQDPVSRGDGAEGHHPSSRPGKPGAEPGPQLPRRLPRGIAGEGRPGRPQSGFDRRYRARVATGATSPTAAGRCRVSACRACCASTGIRPRRRAGWRSP